MTVRLSAVICGFAVIHQTAYSDYKPYWLYLILMTKSGRNDNAVIAPPWARNAWKRFTGSDGLVHSIPNTTFDCNMFYSVDEGIAYINTINTNNLPIINELTGKSYKGEWVAFASFSCVEAAQDLLDYYYGVI